MSSNYVNTPYIKEYNKEGILTNPLIGAYRDKYPNRKQRRQHLQKDNFYGNGKNTPLTVVANMKYKRVKQVIEMHGGLKKTILHYLRS